MKRFLVASFSIFLLGIAIFAQTPTGSLSGVVSSPDGGVLPGATVELKFNLNEKIQSVLTGSDGEYKFVQLEPGLYTVTVSAAGFKVLVANEVKIDIGREYSLPSVLEVGSVQETVNVTAGADVITSTSAQVTNTVSPQQILSLPLITRNPLNLVTLQAGAASNPFQGTSINGMRTTLTNTTRDGISINDAFIRTNATDFAPGRPSVDDTGEFTISTSNQEADLGSGGAQIILVTPRGTKDFHGALFAYNRNSKFAANNFFNNRAGSFVATDAAVINGTAKVGDDRTPRPFRNRNQYGGKIGGPLPLPGIGEGTPFFFKNKGFFFFAYEGVKDPLSARATRTILTPSARAGTFKFNRATAGAATAICPGTTVGSLCTIPNIFAFAQSQGFAGIPNTTDPLIQSRILSRLPTESNATGIGDGLNTAGFGLNRRTDQFFDLYTTRIDADITDKDAINGVFSYNFETNLRPDLDATGFDVTPDGTQTSKNKTFSFTYRRIISDNIVNEARFGFFSSEVPFNRVSERPAFFLGAAGTTTAGTLLANLISNPESVFLDQGRNTKVYTLADNLNWVVGKHSLKFGGQMQRYQVNSFNDVFNIPNYILGPIGVAGSSTTFAPANFTSAGGISTAQVATANGLLALLAGTVNSASRGFNTTDPTSGFQPNVRNLQPFRNTNNALYAADRWSISREFTLSLGLRYELFPALKLANGLSVEPVISDLNNPAASLLAGNGTFNVLGTNAGSEFLYYKTDYNNFAPSIGAAYSPSFESGIGKMLFGSAGRSVIRGGYSQIYGNDSIITSLNGTLVGNIGLGRTTNNALGPTGTTLLNDRLSGTLTQVATPAFTQLPRSFLQNNTANQGFFASANAVDPNLQIPLTEQYSFGFQREFFGNTAFEVRYVGSRSKNLARGVDLNQIDVVNNGFLADFQRAQGNLAVNGAERNRRIAACAGVATCIAGVNSTLPSSAAFNSTLAGSTPLTVIPLIGILSGTNGGIGTPGMGGTQSAINATVNANLVNGTVADLAQFYVTQGANNHPTLALPNNTPFVRFYQNPNIGQIELFTNEGSYSYNSLQLEVRRRFSDGLYLQANYTFSKNLTDTVGTSQQLFEPFLQNENRALDRQRADFDQTHVFNFNGIYQLPFGKGKMFLNNGGIIDKVFGGFELSGLVQMGSGSPISFVDTRGTLNRGARSGRQTPLSSLTNAQIRALGGVYEANGNIYFLNPSIIGSDGRASTGFINPVNSNTTFDGQAFFNVGPGQTGNVARTILNGPRQIVVNAALLKNIRFTEAMRVQLRMEAFNLFNGVNFFNNTQLANINSSVFGQITQAGDARRIQFAARFEF